MPCRPGATPPVAYRAANAIFTYTCLPLPFRAVTATICRGLPLAHACTMNGAVRWLPGSRWDDKFSVDIARSSHGLRRSAYAGLC